MGLFGGSKGSESGSNARVARHSSGWQAMRKHLQAEESLRVLDFGATSAGNINLITGMGHSIYMANLVEDAARPEYMVEGDGETTFEVQRFLVENTDFHGRVFDVVLLWDTMDYLPKELVQPVADRLFEVMSPGAQMLALFHTSGTPGVSVKAKDEETTFSRYHLTDSDQLELQRVGARPIRGTYTNRQVESLFHLYSGYKFFLAKDALREVIVTR